MKSVCYLVAGVKSFGWAFVVTSDVCGLKKILERIKVAK